MRGVFDKLLVSYKGTHSIIVSSCWVYVLYTVCGRWAGPQYEPSDTFWATHCSTQHWLQERWGYSESCSERYANDELCSWWTVVYTYMQLIISNTVAVILTYLLEPMQYRNEEPNIRRVLLVQFSHSLYQFRWGRSWRTLVHHGDSFPQLSTHHSQSVCVTSSWWESLLQRDSKPPGPTTRENSYQ